MGRSRRPADSLQLRLCESHALRPLWVECGRWLQAALGETSGVFGRAPAGAFSAFGQTVCIGSGRRCDKAGALAGSRPRAGDDGAAICAPYDFQGCADQPAAIAHDSQAETLVSPFTRTCDSYAVIPNLKKQSLRRLEPNDD